MLAAWLVVIAALVVVAISVKQPTNDSLTVPGTQPQSFSVLDARLLIVLAPGFGCDVCLLSGAVAWWCPGCPGAHRLRPCRVMPPVVSLGLMVLVRRVLAGRRAAASR